MMLAGGVLLLSLPLLLLRAERLECSRPGEICTHRFEGVVLAGSERRFRIDEIAEVRWSPYWGDKRREKGRTELIARSGHGLYVFDGSRPGARAAFESIDAFFADPAQPALAYVKEPPWLAATVAGALGLALIYLGITALRALPSGGRRVGEGALAERPAVAAPGRPWHRQLWVRLMLAGVALTIIVQLALPWCVGGTQGWLEIRCEGRCRMGGLECLPGGAWRAAFDPGDHTIEIWNADRPGNWEPVTVRVILGETTHFVCPPAPPPTP
jgi:hypothetical protein